MATSALPRDARGRFVKRDQAAPRLASLAIPAVKATPALPRSFRLADLWRKAVGWFNPNVAGTYRGRSLWQAF